MFKKKCFFVVFCHVRKNTFPEAGNADPKLHEKTVHDETKTLDNADPKLHEKMLHDETKTLDNATRDGTKTAVEKWSKIPRPPVTPPPGN